MKLLLLPWLAVALLASSASAQCIINPSVTNVGDGDAGSLRQAVLDACAGSTITPAVTGTIRLTTGQIVLTKDVTIQGPGASLLTITNDADAVSISRIFAVNSGVTAVLSGLSVTGGRAGTTEQPSTGGGIYSQGNLTLNRCMVSGNRATANGGGIHNASGSLTVNDSTIDDNYAEGPSGTSGGGIASDAALIIRNSQITRNQSPRGAGVAARSGAVTISDSTIARNSATSTFPRGGGLYVQTSGTVTNTTISDNTLNATNQTSNPPADGGGIWINDGNLTLLNVTITRNKCVRSGDPQTAGQSAGQGGGVYNDFGAGGTISARNTLVAGNTATFARDYYGDLNSQGHNLIGVRTFTISGDTTGNIVGTAGAPVNAGLAPLGFYGGATMTVALAAGSPAIDAANTTAAPQSDQRGAPRISAADIGAFELNNSQNGGSYRPQLPGVPEGEAYDFLLAPDEGAFRYSVTSGALPFGIAIVEPPSTTNSIRPVSIQGTVRQRGTFNLSITATDGTLSSVTDYTIVILPRVDFYVDGAVGNDSGTGAAGSPFKTVFRAIDSASAGYNIHIKQGNYGSDRPRITKRLKFYNWTGVGRASIGKQ